MPGRPKVYDRNQIIQLAKILFWEKGYSGASLTDLTQAMNVSKSTFYSVFENKEALYIVCLESYGKEFFREMVKKVTGKDSVLTSLRSYFKNIALENAGDTPAKGCLLVSSANEIGLTHPALSPVIQDLMAVTHSNLRNALELAKRKSELSPCFDSNKCALYLLNHMGGLRTLVKSGVDPEDLATMVDHLFDNLPEAF